jgi:Spy/CpxP family protein refolding chaperone
MEPSLLAAARDHFDLTESQVAAMESLRHASETAWIETAVEAAERCFDEMSSPNAYTASAEDRDRREIDADAALRRRLDETHQRFLDDFQLLLTPQQQALWPEFERDLLRVSTLHRYSASEAESIDLITLVRGFDIPEKNREPVSAVLREYAETLHNLLVERNRIAEELGPKATALDRRIHAAHIASMRAEVAGEPYEDVPEADKQEVIDLAVAQLTRCDRIRELSDRTARHIAPLLAPSDGAELIEILERCDRPPEPKSHVRNSISGIFTTLDWDTPNSEPVPRRFEQIDSWYQRQSPTGPNGPEPLTAKQIEQLRAIREEFLDACIRLEGKYPQTIGMRSFTEPRTIPTPAGAVHIERDAKSPGVRSEDAAAARQAEHELLLSTKKAIRAVLTVRQRAIVYFH